jgi:hypothetical protein
MLRPLPQSYATTVPELHRLAVYVISPAQRLVNGEIILRAAPGGFGTFPFGEARRVVRVDGPDLVVDEGGAEVKRAPISSIATAASLAGVEPDLALEKQFDVPPAGDLERPLAIEPVAVLALHEWYAFAADVLEALRGGAAPPEDATPVRIWPEHFDSAVDMGSEVAGRRATYGASPGDRHHADPYLYVSPWAGRVDPFFDDPTFAGASLMYADLLAAPDPEEAGLCFLRRGCELIARRSSEDG